MLGSESKNNICHVWPKQRFGSPFRQTAYTICTIFREQLILTDPKLPRAFRIALLDNEIGSGLVSLSYSSAEKNSQQLFSCEGTQKFIILLIALLVSRKAPGTENLVAFFRRDLYIRTGQKAGGHDPNNKATSSTHHNEQRIRGWIAKPDFLCVVFCVFGLLQRESPVRPQDLFSII